MEGKEKSSTTTKVLAGLAIVAIAGLVWYWHDSHKKTIQAQPTTPPLKKMDTPNIVTDDRGQKASTM